MFHKAEVGFYAFVLIILAIDVIVSVVYAFSFSEFYQVPSCIPRVLLMPYTGISCSTYRNEMKKITDLCVAAAVS